MVVPLIIGMTACGDDTFHSGADATATPPSAPATSVSAPTPPTYDPPIEFAPQPIRLGEPWEGRYTVHDAVAYFFTKSLLSAGFPRLTAVELATGKARWTTSVDTGVDESTWKMLSKDSWMAPAIGQVGDQVWVFVAFPAIAVGIGTKADRELARVVALDASDGTTQWTVDFEVAEVWEEASSWGHPQTVGVTEDTLVVSLGAAGFSRQPPVTVGLDVATGAERWRKSDFWGRLVNDGTVIGMVREGSLLRGHWSLEGRAVADGTRLWRRDDLYGSDFFYELGDGLVAYLANKNGTGLTTWIVSTKTGEPVASIDRSHNCIDDRQSVVICEGKKHLVAFDRDTGELLWELVEGDNGRAVPEVVAARSGVIYAEGPRSMVLLDARTGEDIVDDLASFPGGQVVPGFALVKDGGVLYAYPATG